MQMVQRVAATQAGAAFFSAAANLVEAETRDRARRQLSKVPCKTKTPAMTMAGVHKVCKVMRLSYESAPTYMCAYQ